MKSVRTSCRGATCGTARRRSRVPFVRHQPLLVVALQLNFRNHRKIVVSDGKVALIGGSMWAMNISGATSASAPGATRTWKCAGRWCRRCRLVFLEDWFWAANEVPELHWEPSPKRPTRSPRSFPPARRTRRIRGSSWWPRRPTPRAEAVDRLAVFRAGRGRAHRAAGRRHPRRGRAHPDSRAADHLLVWLSAFSYYEQSIPFGVRIFRYHRGFLHQKVMLIDERLARWAPPTSTTARSA
jgi:cardiolipin synthase A/B